MSEPCNQFEITSNKPSNASKLHESKYSQFLSKGWLESESKRESLKTLPYHSERLPHVTQAYYQHISRHHNLRIIKNLRICRDCHNFIRILSNFGETRFYSKRQKQIFIISEMENALAEISGRIMFGLSIRQYSLKQRMMVVCDKLRVNITILSFPTNSQCTS